MSRKIFFKDEENFFISLEPPGALRGDVVSRIEINDFKVINGNRNLNLCLPTKFKRRHSIYKKRGDFRENNYSFIQY